MQKLNLQAHAKINLFLDVLYKRPDGYHEIETVFQSIGLHDDVTLRKIKTGIEIRCPHPQTPSGVANLAYRAAELIFEASNISGGVEITIDKNIPVAAGLGGGSADAAATLVGINKLFGLAYQPDFLMQLGAKLGADVPFCILGGTAKGSGIGEILTPLPSFAGCYLVLANPGFEVKTSWAYGSLNLAGDKKKRYSTKIQQKISNFLLTKSKKNGKILGQEIQEVCNGFFNIFENTVIAKYPIIAELQKKLRDAGALGMLMSGSGPTVFAFMSDESHAKAVAEKLKPHFCIPTITSDVGVLEC